MANSKKKTNKTTSAETLVLNENDFICGNMNFGASEAYKMLRTNLKFALGKHGGCKTIGITSSNNSEGKSLCSINLAYTLSLSGARTLLVDGDMRVPTIAKYLDLQRSPGMRELLKGQESKVIQASKVSDTLKVISAGHRPSNPSELIGSDAMEKSIGILSESFDYIVFDLPPVNEVSDALTLSRFIDGLLVVVHQDITTRKSLKAAVNQLQLAHANVLGFVLVDSDGIDGKYKKEDKYGKYGKYSKYDKYGKYAAVQSKYDTAHEEAKQEEAALEIGEIETPDTNSKEAENLNG